MKGSFKDAVKALAGKRVLVVGLASTGTAVSRFLAGCGALVAGTDLRPLSEIAGAEGLTRLGVRIEAGGHEGALKRAPQLVVVSPGVPKDHALLNEARGSGAEVISDIELASRFMDAPVLAVAGTNGKSTTTGLLGRVVRDAGFNVFVGGNIGRPAIEYAEAVMEKGERWDFSVLEISSFHLETTAAFCPHVGALLNITPDHLDRYKDFDAYARTKFRLFENQGETDYAIVNADDRVIAKYLAEGLGGRGEMVKFSASGDANADIYLGSGEIIFRDERYPIDGFKLRGLHNIENMMAVIASARAIGVGGESIIATLNAFEGLCHRMEFVRELDGAVYIDDSKGTNIGALYMALKGIKTPVVLIAGGRDKGGDYRLLADLVKDRVKAMVLIGEARFKMNDALGGLTRTSLADSLEDAVRTARSLATRGDTVLLGPACSSFDMFKSYKERGECFKSIVMALESAMEAH